MTQIPFSIYIFKVKTRNACCALCSPNIKFTLVKATRRVEALMSEKSNSPTACQELKRVVGLIRARH